LIDSSINQKAREKLRRDRVLGAAHHAHPSAADFMFGIESSLVAGSQYVRRYVAVGVKTLFRWIGS
jgi:hypothetical protein